MIWQTVNFSKLVQLLLPTFLQRVLMLTFLRVLIKPLDVIYGNILYKMQHNSQVINLEKMLNEYFQVVGYDHQDHENTKTVFISDAEQAQRYYLYQPEEEQPLYIGLIYVGGAVNVNYRFIVNIPTAYSFVEQKLRAEIDYYKLAGKKYLIQTYEL